jgi:O-methyltransferase involved in polyketide biosynthesis
VIGGGPSRISPTAHYTGYVWARNGLSHPELVTAEGRVLFEAVRPTMIASRLLGGGQLEPYLLARHRAIDVLLETAIESGEVSQVLEVACGMSPRGWRFAERYGERITYVEADLPGMADRKRQALERIGTLGEHHRVATVDATSDERFGALLDEFDRQAGLAIVTEGLTGYLSPPLLDGLWRRFARGLSRFPAGRYLSDLHVGEEASPVVAGFSLVLSAFVRGRVHLHYGTAREAEEALRACGFAEARLRRAASLAPERRGPGAGLAYIIDASIK